MSNSWSGVRKRLERDLLCEKLRGRVQYFLTHYHGAPDNYGRFAVRLDGKEILFTALTLGANFKGGEVVPSFYVGATFGAVAGSLFGIPAPFAAAVGLVSVFCGATNAPLASVFLAVELFGDGGMTYYACACVISYVLSGYSGLYNSQTILYSKLKARYINVRTNAHHMGADGELDRDKS